jgi:hypothetical protein
LPQSEILWIFLSQPFPLTRKCFFGTRSLKDTNYLGASFFFKRGEGDRGNAKKFFPTLIMSDLATVRDIVDFPVPAIPFNQKMLFWDGDIAQSIIFKDTNYLGASFFFKRGEGDRGNAKKFFPTLIRQLMLDIMSGSSWSALCTPDLSSEIISISCLINVGKNFFATTSNRCDSDRRFRRMRT